MVWDAPAVVLVIGAIGLLIVNTITAWRNSAKSDAIVAKVDAVDAKAAEIHTLTNSANSKLQADLGVATERILGLEKLMTQMVEANKTAATAKVASDLALATASQPPMLPVAPHDGTERRHAEPSMAESMRDTADNTARTVDAVKDLKDK